MPKILVGSEAIRRKNPESEWIVIPDAHKAIIPRELFDKVQDVLTAKRPKTGVTRALSSSFLLTPILWCLQHNCRYVAYPNQERLYYICSERNRKGNTRVPCPLLKKEAIEDFILQQLREEIFTPDRVRPLLEELSASLTTQADEDRQEVERIRAELRKLEGELSNFYRAIADGIPASQLKMPIDERLGRQAEMVAGLDKLT